MKMRKSVLVVAATGVAVLGMSAPAFAGEITGNGKTLEPLNGKSICAYSGLNDEITADEPTRTQSYGTFLQLYGKWTAEGMGTTTGAGIQAVKGMLPSPGFACNPTSDFEE